MKTHRSLLRALVATLLLALGLTRASAMVDPAPADEIAASATGAAAPCSGCIDP